jgi:hypothetical protein
MQARSTVWIISGLKRQNPEVQKMTGNEDK